MTQLSLLPQAKDPRDVVYTHPEVAKAIITEFRPSGYLLDPCRGDGAFFKAFPRVKGNKLAWCEISEGRDFYSWTWAVDWVIGNPPYSIFHEFLKHSFSIADHVLYLLPINKVFNSQRTMTMIKKWGGVRRVLVYGAGYLIGFPFGYSVGVFHFERGYKSSMISMAQPAEEWRARNAGKMKSED